MSSQLGGGLLPPDITHCLNVPPRHAHMKAWEAVSRSEQGVIYQHVKREFTNCQLRPIRRKLIECQFIPNVRGSKSAGGTLCSGLASGTPSLPTFDKHLDLPNRHLQIIGFEHVRCGVEPRA